MTTERTGAVVLAGGRSARFGRDKLAEPVGGAPLLDHAIDAVRAVVDEVVVVVAAGTTRVVPEGVRVAVDPSPFEGPLAGAATGLAAFPAAVGRVILVGGDMPSLQAGVLTLLLGRLDALPAVEAAILEGAGPLPLAVRRAAALDAAVAILAEGQRRLRRLPERLDAAVVGASAWRAIDPDALTLRDIDEPGDLPPGRG